jgi:hypothetical protein
MPSAARAHAFHRSIFSQMCCEWGAFAHIMATLVLLIALAVMVATKDDALQPRRRLRADVMGCLHVWNAPAVEAAHLTHFTTLSDIRLTSEFRPHSTWARRVEIPAEKALYPGIRLSWVADSMTDSIRVVASDGFVGVTMTFAASPHSSWWGRAEAWTDIVGAERDLGRIRVDPIACSKEWTTSDEGQGGMKARTSSRSHQSVGGD